MARVEEASFEYLQWSELYEEEKPYEIFLDDTSLLNGVKRTNLEFKRSPVQQIQDIRGNESSYSLDTHGFQWVTSSVNVQDLRNEKGILGAYIPAMECLLLDRVEGADRVIIFDWRVRPPSSDCGESKLTAFTDTAEYQPRRVPTEDNRLEQWIGSFAARRTPSYRFVSYCLHRRKPEMLTANRPNLRRSYRTSLPPSRAGSRESAQRTISNHEVRIERVQSMDEDDADFPQVSGAR